MVAGMRQKVWAWMALAALGIAFVPWPTSNTKPQDRTIRVEASSFAFTPGILRVNTGDRVTIELISMDVVHGLYLDSDDLQVQAEPGQPARLTFTADRPGTFRFRCSVTCGAMHPFMIGKINVGPNTLLWRGMGLALLAAVAAGWSLRR